MSLVRPWLPAGFTLAVGQQSGRLLTVEVLRCRMAASAGQQTVTFDLLTVAISRVRLNAVRGNPWSALFFIDHEI